VVYDGRDPLLSNSPYFWKVRTWDRDGDVGPYSAAAPFVVGLEDNRDWVGAMWIRRESADEDDYSYYRKRFFLKDQEIERATLYVTAVHKYELYLNGRLIGTGPAYHYPPYQYYNAYDVTAYLVAKSENVFALFNHWFGGGQGRPRSKRGIILKAIVEYRDGSRTIAGTDGTWKQQRADGWVLGQLPRNDEGVGYVEVIDAARLIPDWYLPAYDDSGWDEAVEIGPQPTPPWTGKLTPDLSRIVERPIQPVSISDQGDGRYVIDLGKVYAGRPQVIFSGGTAGRQIVMQGGYTLTNEGVINPCSNQNTDMGWEVIDSGQRSVFRPQEYLGMRYFQVDNAPMAITAENFSFLARHAVLDGSRSSFTSSNPTLNAVWEMMKHSLYLGAQEQFLDTPTREKGGFLVDSMNESLAAMAAFGERVLTRRTLHEFLQSMEQYWEAEEDRGRMNAVYPNGDGGRDIPDFTQAYLVWVWAYYMETGDKAFLSAHYPKLKSITDYVNRHRDSRSGLIHKLRGGSGAYGYGIVDWPPSMRYGYDMTAEARTVINAYAYVDNELLEKIAAELGETTDCAHYRTLADGLKTAINERLLNADGVYVDGLDATGAQSGHVSQHANMFPLALGIVPAEKRAGVLAKVKELKMSVGMVTVWWLIQALGEMEEGEQLLELYTNAAWDGWAKNLAQGATSTWESWDADRGEELSLSHPWGAVGLCGIQRYILGVRPLTPQYGQVEIKPLSFGENLTSASGKVPTERGDIDVYWKREDGRFLMTLTVPANVQAKVTLPHMSHFTKTVIVNGVIVDG
jgi:alpha-L-rhamnosidase